MIKLSLSDIFDNLNEQTKDLQAVTFDDLLSFAYQVAKGMEFLSSKNVGMKTSILEKKHLKFTRNGLVCTPHLEYSASIVTWQLETCW